SCSASRRRSSIAPDPVPPPPVDWLPLLGDIADRADEIALTFFGAKRLRVDEKPDSSPVTEADQAIETMARALVRQRQPALGLLPGFAQLVGRIGHTRGFGDFYQHMLVAEGAGEVAIDPVMHPWDIAALQVIVEEAGGRATSLGGERSIYAGSLVTSNGALHEAMLDTLSRATEGVA